jgi:hypothetical protein
LLMLKWTSLVENALRRRGQRLLNGGIHRPARRHLYRVMLTVGVLVLAPPTRFPTR